MTRSSVFAIVAIAVFALFVGAAVATAAQSGTLGFDFVAYYRGAERAGAGHPLYDLTVEQIGPFGVFLYPPPFAIAMLPFTAAPLPVATAIWITLLVAAVVGGTALLPVSAPVRWATLLLAGLSWPLVYAIKLGQVGPVLYLLFAIGWRWMDRPAVFGAASALGTIIKIQPGIVLLWAALTGRRRAVVGAAAVLGVAVVAATLIAGPRAWADYIALLRNVSNPITTPHNFTPGAIAYQLGVSAESAALLQLATSVAVLLAVVLSTRVLRQDASYLVAVVASQLLSPVLWDHYALLLLLPTAWLLERGARWAIVIPLATSTFLISITPAVVYPVSFVVAIAALLAVGRPRPRGGSVAVSEPARASLHGSSVAASQGVARD